MGWIYIYIYWGVGERSRTLLLGDIQKNRNLILKGICWMVGDGKYIFFGLIIGPLNILNWFADWIPKIRDIDWNMRVSHFIRNGAWNIEELRKYANEDITKLIVAMPPPIEPPYKMLSIGVHSTMVKLKWSLLHGFKYT